MRLLNDLYLLEQVHLSLKNQVPYLYEIKRVVRYVVRRAGSNVDDYKKGLPLGLLNLEGIIRKAHHATLRRSLRGGD